MSTGKPQKDGWKFTNDFHVTCLYLNRDEEIAESNVIYENFEEDVHVSVKIEALVVVPNKILTGICFPD